jgi:hypothetical protein
MASGRAVAKAQPGPIETDNVIQMYFHCRECVAELPAGESPADYQRIQAGWTARGFQVWCRRHELNIMHVDFEGQKHPAATYARRR